MKKIFTLLLALVATTTLWAEDFSVGGIYYKILNGSEVAVTYRGSYSSEYNEYSGSVTIPETVTYNGTTYSVTSIGESAFYYCYGLTSITIPNSVTSIGDKAFMDCWNLTSITIPNSVTSIGDEAFWVCDNLTSITIPNNVTSIGYRAFSYCSSLTSVTLGNNVTSIGYEAFAYCSSLTSITIPNRVTSIDVGAFRDCSGLTSITIPNSVTSIGCNAFDGTGIYNNESNWENGVLYISNCLIEAKDDISGAYIIKEGTRLIGEYAFYECSSLISVTIPNSVTSIGYGAFSNCSGLTSIIVEDANSRYDSRDNCNAIIETAINTLIAGCQNTIIPNSVTGIGYRAFYECSGLTSITIPNSVTYIAGGAFSYCKGLTSITIPNSVTSIRYEAFKGCSSLTSVTIPNSVTSIGSSAFEWCSGLTSVTIGNSVTSIGDHAFYDCSGLTSVTIPNSVTSIGDFAFARCSGLTSITSLAEIPPTLGTDVFYKVSNNIPVYVRCGTVSAYQSAEGWKDFTNIQCMPEDESAVDNVHSQYTNCQKILRDGQLIILRDGKTYNARGVEL